MLSKRCRGLALTVVTALGVFVSGANARCASSSVGEGTPDNQLVASSSHVVCASSATTAVVGGGHDRVSLSSGRIPAGFPRAVPITKGAVVGGSIGKNAKSWVVAVRMAHATPLKEIGAQLKRAGFVGSMSDSDARGDHVGVFVTPNYCVAVMVWMERDEGHIATYVVTTINRFGRFTTHSNKPSPK